MYAGDDATTTATTSKAGSASFDGVSGMLKNLASDGALQQQAGRNLFSLFNLKERASAHRQQAQSAAQTAAQTPRPQIDAKQSELLLSGTNWTATKVSSPSSLKVTSFGGVNKCGASLNAGRVALHLCCEVLC